MAFLFDELAVNMQAASQAASGRDMAAQASGGGDGPRGSFTNSFAFGSGKANAKASADTAPAISWPWLLAIGAAILAMVYFSRRRK